MIREISSGGVVLRQCESGWEIAVIEPQKETAATEAATSSVASVAQGKTEKPIYALPKGLVDPGEKPDQTAVREVWEETGVTARIIGKLADTKYVYVRKWSDQAKVFKIVSFYLLMYEDGEIDQIAPEMRIEVHRALWMPIAEAAKKLSYSTEKKVVRQAIEELEKQSDAAP